MVSVGVLRSERLEMQPVDSTHLTSLREIRRTRWVGRWWGSGDEEPEWPADDSDTESFAICSSDIVVGFIQCYETLSPAVRYAGIDVFIAEAYSGKGLGREAITRIVEYLVQDKGHHRLVIDPAVDNERAIACYRACGFTSVGVMKAYERNHEGAGWHDALLMELVIPP